MLLFNINRRLLAGGFLVFWLIWFYLILFLVPKNLTDCNKNYSKIVVGNQKEIFKDFPIYRMNKSTFFIPYQPSPKFIALFEQQVYLIDAFLKKKNEIWILIAATAGYFENTKVLLCSENWVKDYHSSVCDTFGIVEKIKSDMDTHQKSFNAQIWVVEGDFSMFQDPVLTIIKNDMKSLEDMRNYLIEKPDLFSLLKNSLRDKNLNDITVCSGPHWGYDRSTVELWEWLEYQSLLGARRVKMYLSKDIPASFIKTLSNFTKFKFYNQGIKNFVEIIEWNNLPDNLMHYRSQVALINHCIISSHGDSKYVMINDIDEFVFPVNKNSWLSVLENEFKQGVASVRFKNWFFDSTCRLNNETLRTTSCIIKDVEPWTAGREKYVVLPDKVKFAGIHTVYQFSNGEKQIDLSPAEMYLHHFSFYIRTKNCDVTKNPGKSIDNAMARFGEKIKHTLNHKTYLEAIDT